MVSSLGCVEMLTGPAPQWVLFLVVMPVGAAVGWGGGVLLWRVMSRAADWAYEDAKRRQ